MMQEFTNDQFEHQFLPDHIRHYYVADASAIHYVPTNDAIIVDGQECTFIQFLMDFEARRINGAWYHAPRAIGFDHKGVLSIKIMF